MTGLVRYARRGGGRPPPDRELLEIDAGGSFRLWRSLATASDPPTPVGRFSGSLGRSALQDLRAGVAAAAPQGDLVLDPPPGAALETIEVEGATATMGHHGKPPGPWGDVAALLRRFLWELTAHPEAAVALDLGGAVAALTHLGRETIRLDTGRLHVRVVHWLAEEVAGDWEATPAPLGDGPPIEAGPGWSLPLPFDHPFSPSPRGDLDVYASLVAYDGEERVEVQLYGSKRAE
jgi:hypothetical protein